MTSRKWPARRVWVCQRRWVASWVKRPMSSANTGSNGSVASTISALDQSTNSRQSTASGGTTAAATSDGR